MIFPDSRCSKKRTDEIKIDEKNKSITITNPFEFEISKSKIDVFCHKLSTGNLHHKNVWTILRTNINFSSLNLFQTIDHFLNSTLLNVPKYFTHTPSATHYCWSKNDVAADLARGKWTTEWWYSASKALNDRLVRHRFSLSGSPIFSTQSGRLMCCYTDGKMQNILLNFLVSLLLE